MIINRSASAGTLESSDVYVLVEPNEGGITLDLESSVINQYGDAIKSTVLDVLTRLEVKDVNIKIVDKGALDCTIKARVECAVFRGNGNDQSIKWGEEIV